jgi:tripartite ATP-independent transporter DctP family solute receptor
VAAKIVWNLLIIENLQRGMVNMKAETKRILSTAFTVLLAGSVLAGCGGKSEEASTGAGKSEAAGPKYTFRLAETHPADFPTTLGDKKFADLVHERTNGRIKIDVFANSQLGEEKAVLEQVQLGAIEFTRTNSGVVAGFSKNFEAFSLPYIFESETHLWKLLESDMGNKLLDSLESSRMKGLAYYEAGSRSFYSTKPVKTLQDLKGQKIRVIQNKVNIDLMSALGANATPMAYGQVFSSLQTGVIDAAENNFASYYTSSHYQQAKHLIMDKHQMIPEVLLVSKTVWDRLNAEDQKIIKQAALDSVKTQKEEWAKYEKDAAEKVKAAGVTVTEIADLKPWQDAVKPVIEKYRGDYKEFLDAVEKAK